MGISFSEFVVALGAKQSGTSGQYTAHCPVPNHGKGRGDRNRSFSITERDGRVLVCCYGYCRQDTIIEVLESRGLWPVETEQSAARTARIDQAATTLDVPPGLIAFDLHLVAETDGFVGHYLSSRGLDLCQLADIQSHPRAWHKPSNTRWPCMAAAVRDVEDRMRSIHRTFLSYDDPPRKAGIEPNRMLYAGAPCAGCAIHLAPAAETLLVGEGLESTASAMKLFNLPGWSAISARLLAIVQLPAVVREVVIAADNDPPGLRAVFAAAYRFRREGRRVRVVKPDTCDDFNSLLMQGAGLPQPLAGQAAGGRQP